MRYAILSDIHANLQAWNAVLLDLRTLDVDKIICLGDIVGYGPNPQQVLESVYTSVDYFVLGNHDAVLCGKINASMFNDTARIIIDWTRKQLNRSAVRFLSRLPLSLEGKGFRLAHGELSQPAYFNYVVEPEDAVPSWRAFDDRLLFVGHTHRPAIFLLGPSGIPRKTEAQDFALEAGKRYLVNVGSVGQPRDADIRASYCVFDPDRGHVFWRRIPFDIDAYRSAVEKAGIPISGSYFLRHDPRAGVPPLREMLSFSPAKTSDMAAKNVVEVQSLEVLQKRVKKWRGLFIALASIVLFCLLGGSWAWIRHAHRSVELAGYSATARFPVDSNSLSVPASPVANGAPIPGWSVFLGDKYKQSAEVRILDDGIPQFVLSSQTEKNDICLSSPLFIVEKDMRISMQALFKKEPDFKGNVAMFLETSTETDSGEVEILNRIGKSPNIKRKDGWWAAKNTPGLPARAKYLRFQIRGNFTGTVRIKDVSLENRL